MSAPFELAMTHWANGERCARSAAVQTMAHRMRRWKDAPEGCVNCGQPALAIRSGQALCGVCREQRAERTAFAPARDPFESRESGDAEDAVLRGHAIVFNSLSVDLGGFRERIMPDAVNRLIAERSDLFALWNHDAARPIGRASAGSLTYRKDRAGLAVEISPNVAVSDGRDAVERVRDRVVTGMSFAFRAIEDDWHMEDSGPIRELLDMDISEVSPVSFPAYPETDLSFGRMGRRVDWAQKVLRIAMAR